MRRWMRSRPQVVSQQRRPKKPGRDIRLSLERLEDRIVMSAGLNEFGYLSPMAGPFGIVAGPDGNLWFTEAAANQIGRITPSGAVTEFSIPTPASSPQEITVGPDGNLWFTEAAANQIGTITPDGQVSEFALPTPNSQPTGITAGPDGNLWFTETAANQIGTITPDGQVSEFPLLSVASQPQIITLGPDNNLWFTESAANQIGTITPDGQVSEFSLPTPNSQPTGITAGPDGNLWFTEAAANQIGTIAPDGTVVSEVALPTQASGPRAITSGADQSLWFTEQTTGQLGQITLDGQVSEYALANPGSQPAGITLGPDNNLWFTEFATNQIGQVVPNAALRVVANTLQGVEGTSFHGDVATFTDTARPNGQATDYTATIQWGDGTTSTGVIVPWGIDSPGKGKFSVRGTHTYAEEGNYAITVRVSYADGSSPAVGHALNAVADAPLAVQGTSIAAVEGLAFSGTVASFRDANPYAQAADFTALIQWGDGTTSDGVIVPETIADRPVPGKFLVRGAHTYTDEGSYPVMVTILDAGGVSVLATSAAAIADAPLTATGTTVRAMEGMAFAGMVASFADANPNARAAEFMVMIRWGDGQTSMGTITANTHGGFDVSGTHTYADEGSYSISVTITDVGGSTAPATTPATVVDAPLTATAGSAVRGVEGAAVSGVLASFTDANPNARAAEFTAMIRWGDGQTSMGMITANTRGGFDVTATHTYADEGSYAISVTIADVGGSTAPASVPATIADAPLTATNGTLRGVEGAAASGVLASFTDANPNARATEFTAMIRWGDGQTSMGTITANTHGGFDVSGTHTYADEGSYSISITIADVGGSTAPASTSATIADAPLNVTPQTVTATEAQAFTNAIVATFTDAGGPEALSHYTATINWGDGTATIAGTITLVGSTFRITGSHTYGDAGTYRMTITVQDVGGASTTINPNLTVADAPLSATAGSALTITEGQVLSNVVVATFTDSGGPKALTRYSATIDWGDGSTATTGVITLAGTTFSITGSHVYTQSGMYRLSVTARDLGGASATATLAATVADASLTAGGVNIQANVGLAFNGVVANFTDANSFAKPGDFTAQITWGDGHSSAGTVAATDTPGKFTVSGTNTYTTGGAKTVSIRITDKGGSTATATATATVIAATVIFISPMPGVLTNRNITITGRLNGTLASVRTLQAQPDTGTMVNVPFDQTTGNFQYTTTLAVDGTADGSHTVHFTFTDQSGTISRPFDFMLQLSATPPVAHITPAAVNYTTFSFFDVVYTKAMAAAAFQAANYMLAIDGGPQDGQAVAITSVSQVDPMTARLTLAAPLANLGYRLSLNAAIVDQAGNPLSGARLFRFAVSQPVHIAEIAPADGEQNVSVARVIQVRFDGKVNPATVTANSFYIIANGTRLTGAISVSSTQESATLVPSQALPPSTEVRIVVDGNQIKDPAGLTIDGDGDGRPGGVGTADFHTLPLTRLPGTNIFGYVYDAYNKNPDGSNIPVVGATIRVDAFPEANAVTDSRGYFILRDMPAPEFFVHVDGSTAVNAPPGTGYPSVGKAFHDVPGQTVQLNMSGVPFNIYLPPMAAADLKNLSPTQPTNVGFGPGGKAELAKMFPSIDPSTWDRLSVTYPAGSAVDNQGHPATQGAIIPVPPDRLPAPLPPGQNPKLVISIQAGEATRFDVPAPAVFPNLDGLAPGQKSVIWSFNHAAARWDPIGTGTVSADGKTIVTDPGVGILAPGWHFTQPGDPTNGPPKPPPKPPCITTTQLVEDVIDVGAAVAKCAGELTGILDAISKAVQIAQSIEKLYDDAKALYEAFHSPDGGGVAKAQAVLKTIVDAKGGIVDAIDLFRKTEDPVNKALQVSKCINAALDSVVDICNRLLENKESPCYSVVLKYICTGLDTARALQNQVNKLIEDAEAGLGKLSLDLVCGLIDKIASALGFGTGPGAQDDAQTSQYMLQLISELGVQTANVDTAKSLYSGLQTYQQTNNEMYDNIKTANWLILGQPTNAFYLLKYNNFELRGRTNSDGQFSSVLPPNTDFSLYIYDQNNYRLASYTGHAGPSGSSIDIPILAFLKDYDGPGMSDQAADVLGLPVNSTQAQRLKALARAQLGLDPLDNTPFPTGVISSLPLKGEAKGITLVGSSVNDQQQVAYVATGSYGLAIIDGSQFVNPIVLGQIQLTGDNVDVAVDSTRSLAVIAARSVGLHLVDVSDPMQPVLVQTIDLPLGASAVKLFDGVAYVASGRSLISIDLATGEQLQTLNVGQGEITGLAQEGNFLYTMDSSRTLHAVDISGFQMVLHGSVTLPDGGGKLFVFNGIAYAAAINSNFRGGYDTVNVSNPDNLVVIHGSDFVPPFIGPGTSLIPNGSGLGLLIGSNGVNTLDVMDISNPMKTNVFLTRILLPSAPLDATLGSGIAFVADGSSGLQVVNYLGFDTKGIPPTVSISSPVGGTQIVEGSSIPIRVNVADDVQVRNVELLVNGQLVLNNVAPPYDFVAIAPKLATGVTQVTIQVRATDTGGNFQLSNILTYTLVKDTFPPTIIGATPAAGSKVYYTPSIDVQFSKPLNTNLVSLSGLKLINLGDNSTVPLGSVQVHVLGRRLVVVPKSSLDTGSYRLIIDPSIVVDLAGNPLASPYMLDFTILPASDLKAASGFPTVPRAPSANVGQELAFRIVGADGGIRLAVPTIDPNGNRGTALVSPSRIDAATGRVFFVVPSNATTGNVNSTHVGAYNFNGFFDWNVTRGLVNLYGNGYGDYFPAHGLYADLDGGTYSPGRLESKTTFSLAPGQYQLQFDLAGSQRGDSNTVTVSLGTLYKETFTLAGNQPFGTITRTITVNAAASATLVFEHTGGNSGLLLDNVQLVRQSDKAVLLGDDFNFGFADGPIPLQVVPTINLVEFGVGNSFHNSYLHLGGSGFQAGDITVNFGALPVVSGIQVYSYSNDRINLTVPNGAPFGPITITTAGGTTVAFPVTLSGIMTTALSGTPVDATQPSANPGQAVTLMGSGLNAGTGVVFTVVDNGGNRYERVVRPLAVSADGTQAIVVVPGDAVSGTLDVIGDGINSRITLQVIPLVTSVEVLSVADNNTGVRVRLHGQGFVRGNGSTYTVGGTTVTDPGPGDFYVGYINQNNDFVDFTLPNASAIFGAITVKTAGGTSVPFTIGYTGLVGRALRGTPADATKASANAGQTITLTGSGLSYATGAIAQYTGSDNRTHWILLRPNYVNAAGTEAAFQVPSYFNGTPAIQIIGSATSATLQIVPDISSAYVEGGYWQLRINGSGLVTGHNSVYQIGTATLTDTGTGNAHVGYYYSHDNDAVELRSLPAYSSGLITVTTAGGTSAPLPLSVVYPALGDLRDVGVAADGSLWVTTPDHFAHVNATTGAVLANYALPGGFSWNNGLNVLTAAITLNGTNVAAGNLLLLNGNTQRVYAVNAANGTVLATLVLDASVGNPVALTYDPTRGSLYVLRGNPDQVLEINPATGKVLSTLKVPFAVGEGGLARNATTGDLWVGSHLTTKVAELKPDGTVVQQVDLAGQGLGQELTGLTFDANGKLLVSSYSRGVILRFDVTPITPVQATLTAITTVAKDGTPADAAKASANVAQTIDLAGSNFTFNTRVIFPTRDNFGNVGSVTVSPTAVSADGTRLQVIVPDVAQSGTITLANGNGSAFLQVVPVITGLGGRPGIDSILYVYGSGFMDGATTLTVSGISVSNRYTNRVDGVVTGNRNDQFQLAVPLAVEGPITITTPGGSYRWSVGAVFAVPPFVEYDGLQAAAAAGLAADPTQPSANTGQTITLVGRGFTNGTLVQFPAADDTGVAGTLTRTGTPNGDGTRLTVVVPALARTGLVRVIGTNVSFALQIVPTLRSLGGALVAGQVVVLEGTGLGKDAQVRIDGQLAMAQVRTIASERGLDQQIATVTVPAGISTGVVTVQTAGGRYVLRAGVPITALPDVKPTGEVGDTLATATAVSLPADSRVNVLSTIGDSNTGSNDVDLYRFSGNAGDVLGISLSRLNGYGNGYVRLFDAAGNQLAADGFSGPNGTPRIIDFQLAASGTFYIGVSSWSDTAYDPTMANSGRNGYYTGAYTLTVERLGASGTRLTGITATAGQGTAAVTRVSSANTGQTITLTGQGLQSTDRVVFTIIDGNGILGTQTVSPTMVAADGSSLQVVVPDMATAGMVRLERDAVGLYLQVVPTLTVAESDVNNSYHNARFHLHGSGFARVQETVSFGNQALVDNARAGSPFYLYYYSNTDLYLTVPNGVPFGPITVSTLGGTSVAFPVSVTGITATAQVGTPAVGAQASANPGQALTVQGSNLTMSTEIVFQVADNSGNVYERVARPLAVNADGTQAIFIVPVDAISGPVSVVGDRSDLRSYLQIIPLVTSMEVLSVSGDGSSVRVRLHGRGFVRGHGSTYTFGGTTLTDPGPGDFYVGYINQNNDFVDMTLPNTLTIFGAITVQTVGGTSAPLTIGYTGLKSKAARGTPADASLASANVGQVVTLTGSGLSMGTLIFGQYIDSSGNQHSVFLRPNYADVTGTEVTFQVPNYFNGALAVHVIGSAASATLQIVPDVTSAFAEGGYWQVRIVGSGFVAGHSSVYQVGTATVTDAGTGNVHVGYYYTHDNDAVELRLLPAYGGTALTVTTAGGTSDPIPWNVINPALGDLRDVGAAADGSLWVTTPDHFAHVDSAAGTVLANYALPGGFSYNNGLHVLTTAMTLNGVNVAAGNLLVVNGGARRVYAVSAANGTVLANVLLDTSVANPVALTYDPVRGSLWLLRSNEIVEVNPANGQVRSRFNTPFTIGEGGLAIDPNNGDLWVGSHLSTSIAEMKTDGTVVRQINLANQGLGQELTGLAFDANGKLLVSSYSRGVVLRLSLGFVNPGPPTLTAITAAARDGTSADATKASANVAQTISLTGTGFNSATRVIFPTRDNFGNVGSVTVAPTAVSADGTSLQVIVPDVAQTGAVTVATGTGSIFLQIVPVIAGLSGRPGLDAILDVYGSGFMDGATTLLVGGLSVANQYTNRVDGLVMGNRNDDFRLTIPLAVEGPITISTPGGSYRWNVGAVFAVPPFVEYDGLQATAASGLAADPAQPSANTGQAITLVGRGFTNGTLVQFTAADDTGAAGTLTRTGTPNSDGTRLTVVVPALARTGLVRVVGTGASFALQIVPALRSLGGTITAGQVVVLEGTGLGKDVQVRIDGQLAAAQVRTVASERGLDQQLATVTVPAGVSAGVVTVQTAGGRFVLRAGVPIAALPDVRPTGEVGDTLATATAVSLPADNRVNVLSTIGDNAAGSNDVDLYRFSGNAGDVLGISLSRLNGYGNGYVRLFDAAGNQLAADAFSGPNGTPRIIDFQLAASGTFYIGVSSWSDTAYDPTMANSGRNGYYTGAYTLTVERLGASGTRLTGLTATAGQGTAALARAASANTGQKITLTGQGLQSTDRVIFTIIDFNGVLGTQTVSPTMVAADGSSLQVVVPDMAATGMVRLERDAVGLYLQVVPTLTVAEVDVNGRYHDVRLHLHGSGFARAQENINFGSRLLLDNARAGSSVSEPYYNSNTDLYLTVPNGVPVGPITVSTLGGTSAFLPANLTGITATAQIGTPPDPSKPSANPNQTITLQGSGFTMTTEIVFQVVDNQGNLSDLVVQPLTVTPDGKQITVKVPENATSGSVGIVGDRNTTGVYLQVVPAFSVSTDQLRFNGNAAVVGAVARLTNGGGYQDGSFYYQNKVNISRFSTTFSFRLSNPQADGFTFIIQGNNTQALGSAGGDLGYQGITNSVAIKFDLWNNAGEGDNSTGIFTDGRSPSVRQGGLPPSVPDQSVNLNGTGIDLHSEHVIKVNLVYDGSKLMEVLTDTATGASYTTSYTVDIASFVGGSSAYVGFTGATGGASATQDILMWTF